MNSVATTGALAASKSSFRSLTKVEC